jgi:hypothetical protein
LVVQDHPRALAESTSDRGLAAFHLNGAPGDITLNDDPPDSAKFDPLWAEVPVMHFYIEIDSIKAMAADHGQERIIELFEFRPAAVKARISLSTMTRQTAPSSTPYGPKYPSCSSKA